MDIQKMNIHIVIFRKPNTVPGNFRYSAMFVEVINYTGTNFICGMEAFYITALRYTQIVASLFSVTPNSGD